MKKKKHLIACTLLCAISLSLFAPAHAANAATELDMAAAYLNEHGIMVGNEAGNMMLDQGLTRAQLAAILTRINANPEHVAAEQEYYKRQCTFSDVPPWAQVYVGYCAANHLVAGYGNGLYGSNDPVTPAAACTVMLRCLGDVGVDWTYHTACQTAIDLELVPMEAIACSEISRGSMAILIYRTMAKMRYDIDLPENIESVGTTTNASSRNTDGSINVPSDGSRYVPKVGDVIRCDDGTNYTITDVSRYDNNMFSSGPLPSLPTPTCDWSLLPQPELPAAETRHFTINGTEYLFVRNLYETRRMLYTLYNAIGENSETWQNGEPTVHPSGNQKVFINLTIDPDVTPECFWPWRDREIIDPFNSNPCGTHSLEAWDVYKDGVFLRTEYSVYHTSKT
mgnify:CR=1 FL=1